MKKVVIAKGIIDNKTVYIVPCTLLENEAATTLKKIENDDNVRACTFCGFVILNPNEPFLDDLEKICTKVIAGDKSVYFRGDSDKYYITSLPKVKSFYDELEAKL